MAELSDSIEALRRDPGSAEAAERVREIARSTGALKAYADAFAQRGRGLLSRGSNREAIDALIEAALVFEEDLNDLAAARELYREVLRLDPMHRRALFALGVLLHDLGQWDDLIGLYRSRLGKSQDEGERTTLHLYIAEILSERLGAVEAAFEEVTTAARLAPQNIRIITRLEQLGERASRMAEVAVVIGDLILHQQDPRVRAALSLRLAELHVGPLGNPQRALAFYRAALADDGGNPELLSEVEDAFRERARFDELAELLEEAAGDRRVGPHRARLDRELARIYELELGDKRRALAALVRAAKLVPHDRDLLEEVLRLGTSIGALEVVATTFDEVAHQTSNGLFRTYLLLKLGHLYAGPLDRPVDAVRAYETILAEDPQHREAKKRLSGLLERVGDWKRLLELTEDELQLAVEPSAQVAALFRLAKLKHRHLGDASGAAALYHRILELQPDAKEAAEGLSELEGGAPAAASEGDWAELDLASGSHDALTELEGRGSDIQLPRFPSLMPPPMPPLSDSQAEVVALFPVPMVAADALEDDGEPFEDVALNITQSQIASAEPIAEIFEAEEVDLADPPLIERSPSVASILTEDLVAEAPAPMQSQDLAPSLAEAVREGDLKKEIELRAQQVEKAAAAGDREATFLAQQELARIDPGLDRLVRLLDFAREAGTLDSAISSVEGWLSGLDLDGQIRMGLHMADLEAAVLGRPKEAAARLSALHALAPNDDSVGDRLIHALERLGDPARVADLCEEMAKRATSPARAQGLRRHAAAIRAQQLDDPSSAADALLLLLEQAPDDLEARAQAVQFLERSGRWHDLIALHESRLFSVDARARAALRIEIAALLLNRLGDGARAEHMLRQAAADDPHDPALLERLLSFYEANHNWPAMSEVLIEQLPLVDVPSGRAHLRRRLADLAEQRLGNPEVARRHLAEAVREDASDLAAIAGLERLARQAEDWEGLCEALVLAARALPKLEDRAARLVEAARIRWHELADLSGAKDLYRGALVLVADHPGALFELAELAEASGDPATAIDILRRVAALVTGPQRAAAHLRLGHLLARELDRPSEAAEEYARALEAQPSSIEAMSELGRYREASGDFNGAITLLEREAVLVADERKKAGLWARAAELARVKLSDFARAEEAYRHVLEADPDDLLADAALGELCLSRGDAKSALVHLTRAARGLRRTDSERATELYLMAGRAAERLQLPEQVLACLEAAVEVAPLAKEPLFWLSRLLTGLGSWDRAYELSATLLLHHEMRLSALERAQAYLQMARARMAEGDHGAATKLAERALSSDPELGPALELLAQALALEGRQREAAERLEALAEITRDPLERRTAQLRAARAFADDARDPAGAIRILVSLHEQARHDVEVAERLAEVRDRAGDQEGAAAVLAATARTLEGRPRADLLVRAGALLSRSAKGRSTARELLGEAMETSPTHREGLRGLWPMLELDRDFLGLARLLERAGQEFVLDPFSAQDAADGNRGEAASTAFEAAKRLYRFRLERPRDALRLAKEQLKIEPSRPGLLEDTARILDEAEAVSSDSLLRKESLERWAELVESEPGLVDGLRRLHARASEHGERWRARAVAEVMEHLDVATARERELFASLYGSYELPRLRVPPPLQVSPHPAEQTDRQLIFAALGMAPLVALDDAIPEPKLRKKDRVQPSDLGPDIGGAIIECAALLGFEVPPLFVRDESPHPLAPAVCQGAPGLVIALHLAAQLPPPVLRFLAGRALSLLRPRALALALLPLDVLRDALEGLVRDRLEADRVFSDVRAAKRRAKALERELTPAARASVAERLVTWLGQDERATLLDEREAVLRTAERFGLVACGSLTVAAGVLNSGSTSSRRWLLPLLRFAASREYAAIGKRLDGS